MAGEIAFSGPGQRVGRPGPCIIGGGTSRRTGAHPALFKWHHLLSTETGGSGRRESHPLFQGPESYSDSRGIPDGTARNLRAKFRCSHNLMMMTAVADAVALHVADHVPGGVRAVMRGPYGAGARQALGRVADGGRADDDGHRGGDERDEDQDAGKDRVHHSNSLRNSSRLSAARFTT